MFKNKKCLVTGGTGLIGRKVCALLVEEGAHVFSVSLDNLKPNKNVAYLKWDLTSLALAQDVTKGMDYVFHLAGVKGSITATAYRPASMFVKPLMMNLNVLEACRVNKVEHVVFVSTVGAYDKNLPLEESQALQGVPMDFYPGWAKRMGELQLQSYSTEYGFKNYTIIRPTSCYGEGDNFNIKTGMFIPALMARVMSGEHPLYIEGDGSAVRDFAYSGDIAKGILQMASVEGNLFNLGGNAHLTIMDVVMALKKVVPFEHHFGMGGYSHRTIDDKLARSNGYNPSTTIEQGIKRTWEWFCEHQDEYLKKQDYLR